MPSEAEDALASVIGPLVTVFNEIAAAVGSVVEGVAAAFEGLVDAWIASGAEKELGRNPYTALAEVERELVDEANARFDAAIDRLSGPDRDQLEALLEQRSYPDRG